MGSKGKMWILKQKPISCSDQVNITLLDVMLQLQIKDLKDVAFICKFWNFTPDLAFLKSWTFQTWDGSNEVFFLEKGEGFL